MVEASSFGLTKAHTKVTSSKIISTVRANIDGRTAASTTVSGLTTRWRVRALLPGVMAVDMLVAIKMIRSMDMERLSGLTAVNTSVNGAKANSTAKVSISRKAKSGKEFGRWVRGLSGSSLQRHQLMGRNSENHPLDPLIYPCISIYVDLKNH